MVYVVDLDDTLVLTKNLNNDAYNFALEQNGYSRIKTAKRITRDNLKNKHSKQIISDKQNYFAQKWLKYRVVVNQEILSLLKKQERKNCYLWTSADKNRAEYILKELDLYKYFNKVIYDDKKEKIVLCYQTKEACDKGIVTINGKVAKSSSEVNLGDILEIQFGEKKMKFKL